MKAIEFPEQTAVLAKDQPQYQQLPVYQFKDREGQVISCWQLSWVERIKVLFGANLWLSQFTFGGKLQPQRPFLQNPFKK